MIETKTRISNSQALKFEGRLISPGVHTIKSHRHLEATNHSLEQQGKRIENNKLQIDSCHISIDDGKEMQVVVGTD